VTDRSFRYVLPPLTLVLLTVAGCGTPSASKGTPAANTITVPTAGAVPTQPVPATIGVTGGSVAAIVNGHSIPMSSYRTILDVLSRQTASQPGQPPPSSKALGQEAMQQIIVNELFREYAAKNHIAVPASQLAKTLQTQRQQNGGDAALRSRIKARFGLDFATYKGLLASSLLGQKVVQRIAPVSTKSEPVAHVRHILVMTHPQGKPALTDAAAQAKARRILQQVVHGGNFASLARKNSDDTTSGVKGGDLGNVYPGQTVPSFDHAAFHLGLHKPTLIHTRFGYHIIEVLGRGMATPPAQSQQQAQQARVSKWLSEQIKHSSIKRFAKVA
jgi:parvulin-like peptidyl-prolyl isomerase